MSNPDYARELLPCPYPQCSGQIPVSRTLPEGVYSCHCRHCKVRLTREPAPVLGLVLDGSR